MLPVMDVTAEQREVAGINAEPLVDEKNVKTESLDEKLDSLSALDLVLVDVDEKDSVSALDLLLLEVKV